MLISSPLRCLGSPGFVLFFPSVLGLELRAYKLSLSTSPISVMHFETGSPGTIYLGWLCTAVLLISAS
jgi:hypothetical protein